MDAINALRLFSVAITIAIFWIAPSEEASRALVYSIAFGHYLIALWYSKKRILRITSQPASYPALLLIALVGYLAYANTFSLVIYFAVHHAFNESYILNFSNGTSASRESGDLNNLRLSAVFFNFFVFLATLRNHPDLYFLNSAFLIVGVISTSIPFLFFLSRLKNVFTRAEMVRACAFEMMGLVILAVSFYTPITFIQVVCYHVVSWVFFPLYRMIKAAPGKITEYALLTAGVTFIFILLSPLGVRRYELNDSFFKQQFFLWSYLHITFSFVFSDAQPEWITRWFNPEKGKRVSELAPQD